MVWYSIGGNELLCSPLVLWLCLGKLLVPKAPENFLWLPEGEMCFVLPDGSMLKILRNVWRIQKWVKNTKKQFDPNLTSGSDLS